MAETLDELVVKIKADSSNLAKELEQIKRKIDKESKDNQTKLSFKAKFDNSVAKLKISELQAYRQKLQTLFDKQLKMNVDAASLDRTRQKIASVNQQLQGVEKSVSPLSRIFGGIGASIGAAFATAGIVRFGFEAVTLAGKVQGVKTAFDNLNQPGLLENLRAATRNTVSDFELMKVAMRAANFKIPLTELSTLLEFAQKRAQQTGQEVDYLVNSIIDGIGRKSTLVLDNLGISATELQTEFAKTGDFGKATANIISREMKNMGDVIDTSATKLAQLNAQLENQKVEIGNQLTPIWSGLLKVIGGGLSVFSAMGQEFKRSVSPARYYGEIIEGLTIKHRQYAAMLEKTYISQAKLSSFIISTYKQQRDTIGQINQRISDLKAEQENLVYGSDEYLKNVKEIEKLEKSIGLGKTTSGGTDYIKELEKSLDNYRDKIRLLNVELKKLGDGSSEKKIILTAEIDKVQKQLNDAEISIGLKVGELDFDAGNLDTSKISDEITKQSEEMALTTAESTMKQKEAVNNYYDEIGAKADGYFQNKIQRIKEESDAILASTENEFLAKEFQIVRLQELEQEYFDWKLEEWRKQNKVADAAFNALESGMTEALQLIKIRTRENVSAVEQAFVDMANTFIAQVERMIAQWLSFQLLKGITGILLAPFTGGTSLAAAAAHSGGEFIGTPSGVKRMASGGSFIVPPGFNNDSYPMLVESGERVSVTPANQVGKQDASFSELSRKLDILNKNLVDKNFSPVINADTYLDSRKLTKAVFKTANRMQKEGRDLNY